MAALAYSKRVRKLLYEASLNKPLNRHDDHENFQTFMQVFLCRDPALYAEVKEQLGAKVTLLPRPNTTPSLQDRKQNSRNEGGKSDNYCTRYAVRSNLCPFSADRCQHQHRCPFCDGRVCQNRPGYLHTHLANLKTKFVITEKKDPDNRRDDRSRSRGQGRRGKRSRSPGTSRSSGNWQQHKSY